MSMLREIVSVRFVTSPQGIVFWFGKLCLFAAVGFAYFAGRSLQPGGALNLPVLVQSGPEGISRTKQRLPLEQYSQVATSAIFGRPKAAAAQAAPPPTSPLKLRLVGVNQMGNGQQLALIEDTQKQKQDVFTVGERIFDQAKLVEIQREKIQVERNGKIETIAVEAGTSGSSPSEGGESPSGQQTEFVVAEDEVTNALANLPQLLSQARAVPYFRNGQSIGMRLFAIRSGSLYEKLGLRNGDIVLAVNDNSLSDPTQALKLFEQLKSERSINVKVERNNENVDLRYSVR